MGRNKGEPRVCPWWVGYLLLSPLRRLSEKPEAILGPHVRPGMKVVEPGCGMGYFSLPLARMVGPYGKVICLDLQKRMIARLEKRAGKAGLDGRIQASVCSAGDLGVEELAGSIDFIPAVHVVHEVPDPGRFLRQVHELLRPGGTLLLMEPRGHVNEDRFRGEIDLARDSGFVELPPPDIRKAHAALLEKR